MTTLKDILELNHSNYFKIYIMETNCMLTLIGQGRKTELIQYLEDYEFQEVTDYNAYYDDETKQVILAVVIEDIYHYGE